MALNGATLQTQLTVHNTVIPEDRFDDEVNYSAPDCFGADALLVQVIPQTS